MTDAPPSNALKNLAVFIIVLAVAATIVALAWYFAIELPTQQALLQAPMNSASDGITGGNGSVGGAGGNGGTGGNGGNGGAG